MPVNGSTSRSVRCITTAMALMMMLAFAASAAPPTCLSKCASLNCSGDHAGRPLDDQYRSLQSCLALNLREGTAKLRYRRNSAAFEALVTKDRSVVDVLREFPPDTCSLGDLACLQQRMAATKATAGGHPADSRIATPAGEGNPCTFGLPCGQVLPPSSPWVWRLVRNDIEGSIEIQTIRSAKAEGDSRCSATVVRGVVTLDAAAVTDGGTYAYRLIDRGGKVVARGEFTVLAASIAAYVRSAVDAAISRGTAQDDALVDALARNRLDWDLFQRTEQWGTKP